MDHSPIILLGTHRSGTTWLGQALSQHPSLAYWEEPRYVWSWGNNYKPDDVLTAQDATPKIVQHIRDRFSRFVSEQKKPRLFEKTPSNCLRVPFIRQVYPEAKILHIIRDGRSVFSSAERLKTVGYYRQDVLVKRFQRILVETPVWEWPAMLSRVTYTLRAKVTNQPIKFWGPRPRGWHDWVKSNTPNVILAKQWTATINQALKDTDGLDSRVYHRLSYEDLVARPRAVMGEAVEFLGLNNSDRFLTEFEKTVDPSSQHKWSRLISADKLAEIRPYLEPVLIQLGYSW